MDEMLFGSDSPKEAPKMIEVLNGIEIVGSIEFIKATKMALTVLENSASFEEVTPYLGRIEETERGSGMRAYDDTPTYQVNKATWQNETMWYAGTIAHDAYYSFLYHKYKENNNDQEPHPRIWTGSEAEKECLEYQLRVAQELQEKTHVVDYLEKQKLNPTYQDKPNRDW